MLFAKKSVFLNHVNLMLSKVFMGFNYSQGQTQGTVVQGAAEQSDLMSAYHVTESVPCRALLSLDLSLKSVQLCLSADHHPSFLWGLEEIKWTGG